VSADEIEFVASVISKYEKEPLVFSHNDLLANNVLIRKDNGKFVFIDYEYCSFNFPIYDIANYFEESQIDYDVTEAPYFAILPQKP
jgi:thiamine kinase-like enzyme